MIDPTSQAPAPAPARTEQDEFVYLVSHDLSAPLRGISNLAQWIEEDLADAAAPQVSEHLRLLRARVTRLELMIDGLLRYSRVDRPAPNEAVDLNGLIAEIARSQPRPQEFRICIQDDLPVLWGPRALIRQVFQILIDNAVRHHHREDGIAWVECRDRGGAWELIVRDDGPGIPARFQDRIFMIFQTLEARDRKECIGVGLTILKKIVEGRGGSIALVSEEGRGSEFRILWPKAERETAA